MGKIFGGEILTGSDLEDAAVAHLKAWTPTYIAQAERERELPMRSLPLFRSFEVTPRPPEKWPEAQLPALLVVSPGVEEVHQQGDGKIGMTWNLGLASICSANSERRSVELAHWYFYAAMLPMLRYGSLGGVADSTRLTEPPDHSVLPVERRRTLASVYGVFQVEVEEALNVHEGPTEPLEDPYIDPGLWPEAVTIDISAD